MISMWMNWADRRFFNNHPDMEFLDGFVFTASIVALLFVFDLWITERHLLSIGVEGQSSLPSEQGRWLPRIGTNQPPSAQKPT